MKRLLLLPALLLMLSSFNSFGQTTWTPVSYKISFKIKNAGITVNGKFAGLKTSIVFDPNKLSASKITGTVEAATLHTGISKRDKTIKDDHYLDVANHKLIEITSVKLYPKDIYYAGLFKVTIKGISKEMEIPFEFIPLGDRADFNATFKINRRDFNVGGSSITMADDVSVSISVNAQK